MHPATGTAPGVLVWPDIFGLRPAFRQMGKRLAESGYSVLVVNPFYRVKKAPTAAKGGATPIAEVMPLTRASRTKPQYDGCESFRRVAGPAIVGSEKSQDGHPGLLHGRIPGVSYRIRRRRTDRRGGDIPWRPVWRPRCRTARICRRRSRRHSFWLRLRKATTSRPPRQGRSERRLWQGKHSGRGRGLPGPMHGWCPPDTSAYNEPQAEKAWGRLLALYGKALA